MSRVLLIFALLVAACAPGERSDYALPSAGDGGAPVTSPDGLPCDVARVLKANCTTCHSDPPIGAAPMPLVTYAQLAAPSPQYPGQTYAQRSLARVQDASLPMPPGGGMSAADVAVLQTWVNEGAPAGSCGSTGNAPPDAGQPAVTPDAGSTPPNSNPDGLPCNVAQVLQSRCLACHSAPPTNGATVPLVTYAQLTAQSSQYPGQTYAQRSLARMQNSTRPMPPGGGASAAEISTIQGWVNSGTPSGSCSPTGSPDGGTPPSGTPDAGSSSVPDSPPVCTSGITWYLGDLGTDLMHPGRACIDCHSSSGRGPTFSAAGTVYPTTHEPDDCDGKSGITVNITDASGQTASTTANSVGNFSFKNSFQFPIRASVQASGRTRQMLTPQMSGDCNLCHTQNGTQGAPGRVVAP